jgi:hypothetical protein
LLGEGSGVDTDAYRYNERFKGFATFGDNAALAFFVGSVAKAFDPAGQDILVVLGVLLGLAFLSMSWHIRGLIQSEVME